MAVSFFETMQGHVTDRWGKSHAIDFCVKAEANRTRQFLRTGKTRLTGTITAAPWADETPVSGSLTLDPVVGRQLTYDMSFTDEDDQVWTFFGQKTIRLRSLVDSMTRMPVRLERDGDIVARGEMRFDLNELGAFGASWRPTSAIRSVDLHESQEELPAGKRLEDTDRAWVSALASALIRAGEHVPAADDQTVDAAMAFLERMPGHVLAGYRAAATGLDAAVRIRTGRSLADLPPEQAVEMVAWLGTPREGHSLHRVVHLLAMPVKAAHFSRPDYLESLGVPDFTHRVSEPSPSWMSQVTPAESLDAETTIFAEVVVVGTGAGGGAIAAQLAEAGVAVAIIEEGPYRERQAFSGAPLSRMRRFYRDSGFTFTVGSPPIFVPTGKMVGGTTAINSGTCFRTPDAVLDEWRNDHGLPSDFAAEPFGTYLDAVEQELQVGPGDKKALGKIADIVARGADAMSLPHAPLPRNAPGCDGQGVCPFGCPTDARRSSNVSWIPRALRAGAELYTGMPVTRILRRGRKVVAVEARGNDQHGAPKVLRVRADAIVISTGTLATPLLLADNGIQLPMMGRNLSVHPGFGAFVMTDQHMSPWNAIPQGYGVHGLKDPQVRLEGFWMPPQVAAMMAPMHGQELTRWMDKADHVGQFGFMVRDQNTGRVYRGPGGRAIARYDLSKQTLARLRLGASRLAEVLIQGGGKEVFLGVGPHDRITTVDQARALEHANMRSMDFNLLGAHPLGTCKMGTDETNGVVDPEHRVFGTDNLYVVDGSTVPSSLGVNPQLTIMAMALRAGERLAAHFD